MNTEMYCLNSRIGVLFRENLSKKSYQLRYFFIDNEANIFYLPNLPKLQKIIRLSKDPNQIKSRLLRSGQKYFQLSSFSISAPKTYHTESVLPFCNRTYIEMREKDQKDRKSQEKTGYMLLGFMDEDTAVVYYEILGLMGKGKKDKEKEKEREKEMIKRKSIGMKKEEEREKNVFDSYMDCGDSFSMDKEKVEGEDSQYDGGQINGKAEGKGKQVVVSKGMTYNGTFHQGKKHGNGYLVDKNLDTMECQFINDQLVGI